jgi:ribosome-binding protein aMBF1 (putative translation factor)
METKKTDRGEACFGVIVRQSRHRRALSQEELATQIQMSLKGLAKIERGEAAPSLTSMLKIMRYLEIPVTALHALVYGDGDNQRIEQEAKLSALAGDLNDAALEIALQQLGALANTLGRKQK